MRDESELVQANSRLALVSVFAATAGGVPAALVQQVFDAAWSLRLGAVVFAIAAVMASRVPSGRPITRPEGELAQMEREEMHSPSIVLAGSAMAVLRGSVGYLAFFAAFTLKKDLFALGAALTASAIGGFVGNVSAPVLRRHVREEIILASALAVPAAFVAFGALAGGATGFVVAALAIATGAAGGRLGFDSILQRDGPDAARGRAFARFETRFQLVWVVGGVLGVIPIAGEIGLVALAAVLGFVAVSYAAALHAARRRQELRTKLLPRAVDEALTRSRDRAIERFRDRVRRRRSIDDGEGTESPGS